MLAKDQIYLNQIVDDENDVVFPIKVSDMSLPFEIDKVVINDNDIVRMFRVEVKDDLYFLRFRTTISIKKITITLGDKDYIFPVSIYYQENLFHYSERYQFYLDSFLIEKDTPQGNTYVFNF